MVVLHTAASYESITATAIYYNIVASILQSQGTTLTNVSQRYDGLKTKDSRLRTLLQAGRSALRGNLQRR